MASQLLDQISNRDPENRAGDTGLEAGDQRRDLAAERETVQPDQRFRLLQPDRQAAGPEAVHREDGHHDVEA